MSEKKLKPENSQEALWCGNFGNEYASRNKSAQLLASKRAHLGRMIGRTSGVRSVIEFGANIGLNLVALHELLPDASLTAVEINSQAVKSLSELPFVRSKQASILDEGLGESFDLVLTWGLLIHIDPKDLPVAYASLYRGCGRYLCVGEYYSPKPEAIVYRGATGMLFKRDFAGDIMERYPDMKLLDYGFAYRKDPVHPLDDISWFLMEKRG